MPRPVQISDSEWDVMEPIWQQGVCTAAEVIDRLGATHDWNHSTIRTLLARLVEKGGARLPGRRFKISLSPRCHAAAVCAAGKPRVFA